MTSLKNSFEIVSYSLASAGFLGIALLHILASIVFPLNSLTMGNILGSSVCLIAGNHYQFMRSNTINNYVIQATRYSDWYITTILMIIEFFNLAGTVKSRWQWLLASCLFCELMLIFGHISSFRLESKQDYVLSFFVCSCIQFIGLAICLLIGTFVQNSHENNWMYIFMALWLLYPIAFWLNEYKNLAYNILDLYSKGVFGIVLVMITFTRNYY